MERQLQLIGVDGDGSEPAWRIDEETRAVGRAGVAEARRALAEALRRSGRGATERTAA